SRQVVIGRDTRGSGTAIFDALASGFSKNITVWNLGIVTSPLLSKAVVETKSEFGLMITASHNPACDNGVKIFGSHGEKIDKEFEAKLESEIDRLRDEDIPSLKASVKEVQVKPRYVVSPEIKNHFRKVVIDSANGSALKFAQQAYDFESTIGLGDHPDGTNINQDCGSEHPEALQAAVHRAGAAFGIAHDGDGDRVLMCDEGGAIVPGEVLLGLIAIDLQQQGRLKNSAIVTTAMSNQGLARSLEKYGIKVLLSDVGDRNVAAMMQQEGCNLGGESSGHIIFSDAAPTSDGIQTALLFLEAVAHLNVSLKKCSEIIALLPQKVCSLPVRQKIPITELPELNNIIQFEAEQLRDQGKVFVRYSGTEPKLRLLVEAPTEQLAAQILTKIRNGVVNCKKIA
ncbi:MAG: phosphoglucosamine mutase, partial [Opitutales bacterium]|nr:phosphoglucosamine mutase [Opitutales bacterium]